jgi:hypothetical protein
VAVVHRIGLAVEVEITARQLGERNALLVQGLDQAGAFGLVRGEFPAGPASGSAYPFGVKQAVVDPVLEFMRGKPRGFAEFGGGYVIGILTPSRRAG